MSDNLTYRYNTASNLVKSEKENSVFLSKYSEVEKKETPCFFWGHLTEPYITARCLITLSNVVQSSFSLSPFEMSKLKDPIVTAGNNTLRFEGFSHCAGVYARVDILPGGHDGEFPASGTTNVDFNPPVISALARINRSEKMLLSVGKKEMTLQTGSGTIVERKVPLPVKWIKGLANVQIFLSQAEKVLSLNRMQALQLFQTLPTGKPKTDYYLVDRGSKSIFSTITTTNAVCIGAIYRLKLLEPLLPLAQELKVFSHPERQATTWQLYFGKIRFSLTISREAWRGFSGEGALLESLLEDVPDEWIDAVDKYSYANQVFNPAWLSIEEGIDLSRIDHITSRLSAMGLLGFDLDDNQFFYRRLPYKLNRIMSLNPRMEAAEKLLEEHKVDIISHTALRIEARVAGTGIQHTVVVEGEIGRCTCTWFSRYQGERGPCKHVLAVRKKILN